MVWACKASHNTRLVISMQVIMGSISMAETWAVHVSLDPLPHNLRTSLSPNS